MKLARSKGWFTGKDADFSWKMAYAKPDFSGRRFCDARAWALLNHFKDMSRYLSWALGKDPKAEDMPLWVVPDQKVSVQDVRGLYERPLRGHSTCLLLMAMTSVVVSGRCLIAQLH